MLGRAAATRPEAGAGLLAVLLVVVGLIAMHVLPGSTNDGHGTTTPMMQTSAGPSSAEPTVDHGGRAAGPHAASASGPRDAQAPPHCAVAVVECASPTPQPVAEHVALAAPPRSHLLPASAAPLWPSTLAATAMLPRTAATHVILRT